MSRVWITRSLVAVAAVTVAGATAFFIVAPGVVERGMNRVEPAELPVVSPQTQRLHDSLHVVDMHADTLMWDRDLLERSDLVVATRPRDVT